MAAGLPGCDRSGGNADIAAAKAIKPAIAEEFAHLWYTVGAQWCIDLVWRLWA
jgi:hypothetical protein